MTAPSGAGARVAALYPVSIPAHGSGVNFTVQSYMDGLDFGVTADLASVPDVDRMGDLLVTAFAELRQAVLGEAPETPSNVAAVGRAKAEAAAKAKAKAAADAAAQAKREAAAKARAEAAATAKAKREAAAKAKADTAAEAKAEATPKPRAKAAPKAPAKSRAAAKTSASAKAPASTAVSRASKTRAVPKTAPKTAPKRGSLCHAMTSDAIEARCKARLTHADPRQPSAAGIDRRPVCRSKSRSCSA